LCPSVDLDPLSVDPSAPVAYADVEREFASPDLADALARLSDAQRGQLWQYWIDRADGELTTALAFEFVLDDLRAMGAPNEIAALAEHAISDEHRHVDWCLRWARRVDDAPAAQASFHGTRPATFEGAMEAENRVLRVVFAGCFSETVAVHVLRASHARITIPSVRRLNHLHMKEEITHARVGWALLGWSGLSSADRDMVAARVPELTALVRDLWQGTRRVPDEALHAFGFLSSAIVNPAVEEALCDVVMPGLAELGVLSAPRAQ
jgi:hypothetical protein